MKTFLINLWRDETGAETAEWLVIVALILVVALAVYGTDGLQATLTDVLTFITTSLGPVTPA
jgi:Flp pilus assembly pilin Flp